MCRVWCGVVCWLSVLSVQCSESQIIENLNILAKTVGSPSNCREPWQPKPKLPVRRERRFVDCEAPSLRHHLFFLSLQVIAADGEQKAARALKEASETIAESSSAMQLRYLQVRERLSVKYYTVSPAARILFSRLSTLSARRRTTRLSSRCPLTL